MSNDWSSGICYNNLFYNSSGLISPPGTQFANLNLPPPQVGSYNGVYGGYAFANYYQFDKKVSPTGGDVSCILESVANIYQNTFGNSGMIVWWNSDNGYIKTTTSLIILDSTTTTPPVQKPFIPTVAAPYVDTNYMTFNNVSIFMIVYSGTIGGNVALANIFSYGICYNNIFYLFKETTDNVYVSDAVENVYMKLTKKVSPTFGGDVWCGF